MQNNILRKKLIVVLGMHRSGTSTVSRALKVFGVELGDNLMSPVENENAKGYWEDRDVFTLNVEILDALNTTWHSFTTIQPDDLIFLDKKGFLQRGIELIHSKMVDVPIFGFKDPRLAILLPFWQQVFDKCNLNVEYVIAIRNPLSVAKSLAKRDGFEFEKSYYLWANHLLCSLEIIEKNRFVIIDYDRLMEAPENELSRLSMKLNLPVNLDEQEKFKVEFLDSKLRHSYYLPDDLEMDSTIPSLVKEIFTILLQAAAEKMQPEGREFNNHIKSFRTEYSRLKPALLLSDKLNLRVDNLSIRLAEKDQASQTLTDQLAEKNQAIQTLIDQLAEKDKQIIILNDEIVRRGEWGLGLNRSKAALFPN